MDRKTITREMRQQFFPLLVDDGFTRTKDTLRRVLPGPVVHVVQVRNFPARAQFRVDLGAHLPALDEREGTAPKALDTLRDIDCVWRGGIVTGFLSPTDTGMSYGTDEHGASEAVAFMASEWKRQSREFFGPLFDFPGGFHRQARRALVAPRHPYAMVLWADVARLVGDDDLSRRIAAAALPLVPDTASGLRARAEALLTG